MRDAIIKSIKAKLRSTETVLRTKGADVGNNVLLGADNVVLIEEMLDNGGDPNSSDPGSIIVSFESAGGSFRQMMRPFPRKDTALEVAIRSGSDEAVRMLLVAGADPNLSFISTSGGFRSESFGSEAGDPAEVIEIRYADLTERELYELQVDTPIDLARALKFDGIVEILREYGAREDQ